MLMASEENERISSRKNVRRGVPRSVFVASLTLAVVIAFAAGTRSDELYRIVAPVFGVKVAQRDIDASILKETYRELASNYDGELDISKLSDGAARGMVEAAGDKHTVFMDKKEATEF